MKNMKIPISVIQKRTNFLLPSPEITDNTNIIIIIIIIIVVVVVTVGFHNMAQY
jgi:fatty-acid desaturase